MSKQPNMPERNPSGRLAGKVAMIVGAGCSAPGWGNGNAVAALFAREGASVYAVDRSEDAASATADMIIQNGGNAAFQGADATSLTDLQAAADDCVRIFGKIDVLENNVGGSLPGGVADVDEDHWQTMLELNLNTAFKACKAVLPQMLEQRSGSIVNISSLAAVSYIQPVVAAYSAAKAGMLQMTRTIAMQHLEDGVRANAIIVGHVDTAEIRRRLIERFGEDKLEKALEIRGASTRIGRSATPWDIAFAALYLASDEANYVTGSEITVDGGMSIPVIEPYVKEVERRLGLPSK